MDMANMTGLRVGVAEPVVVRPFERASENARILLAEDNIIAAELIAMMGHRLGLPIALASDGAEAIEMVRAAALAGRPYSLLLLDAMMPVLHGIEVVKRLRRAGFDAETLPVVAVTAASATDEVKTYLAAGMQAYLPKPVSSASLAAAIRAWAPELLDANDVERDEPARSLTERYETRKRELFDRIEAIDEGAPITRETIRELRDMLHKLAGIAGSFGEERLSTLAAECETRLSHSAPAELPAVLGAFRQAAA